MSDAASQFRDYVGVDVSHIDQDEYDRAAKRDKGKKDEPVVTDQEKAALDNNPDPEVVAAGREDAVSRADKPESGAKKATAKKAKTASGEKRAAKKTAAKKTAAKKK